MSDMQVKKLIEMAMAPRKEIPFNLKEEKRQDLSIQYIKVMENVLEYAWSAPSQQQITTRGTLFGAYNAVTGYFQNVRNFPSEENKFKSIMYGTGSQRARKAFDLCLDFAKFRKN